MYIYINKIFIVRSLFLHYELIGIIVSHNPMICLSVGVRPQLRIALVAMLTFCLIIRKLGKNVRPALRLWGESPDGHLLTRHFGSSVAIWLRN